MIVTAIDAMLYHPLGRSTPLFALWRSAVSQGEARLPTIPMEVLERYRAHVGARLSSTATREAVLPSVLAEDLRQSVRDFRAFFPVFLERVGAPPDRAEVPVSFPTLGLFDARLVESSQARAIFLSSRVLDVVDVFARGVSLNARVFDRSLRDLSDVGDPPQSLEMPTWFPLMDVGLSLADLCDGPLTGVRERVFHALEIASPALRDAYGRRRLTHYVAQGMLLVMERLVNGTASDKVACLDLMRRSRINNSSSSLDERYLATLVLTFIVLHEHAHLAHGHNLLSPMQEDPQMAAIAEGMMRVAKQHDDIETIDVRGSTQQLEQDADGFAFEITSAEYREAMLEAASLWLTALACAARAQPSMIGMALATYLPVVQELWTIAETEAARPPT